MITMSSIGYGDISPVNAIEATISIFFVFFSTCMFGFSLNQISSILDGFRQKGKQKE